MNIKEILLNETPISIETSEVRYKVERMSSSAREKGEPGLRCKHCGNLVRIQKYPDKEDWFAAHLSKEANEDTILKNNIEIETTDLNECPYYHSGDGVANKDMFIGEQDTHRNTKNAIAKRLRESNIEIVETERFIRTHNKNRWKLGKRADVYAVINGIEVVFEIQTSWMSPDEIHLREVFYKQKNIKLIWIFCENENKALSSGITVDRVKNGSYREQYKIGCSIVYARLTNESVILRGEIQPFIKYNNKVYYYGDIYELDNIWIYDFRFMEHTPLMTLWNTYSLETIFAELKKCTSDKFIYEVLDNTLKDLKVTERRVELVSSNIKPNLKSINSIQFITLEFLSWFAIVLKEEWVLSKKR